MISIFLCLNIFDKQNSINESFMAASFALFFLYCIQ